MGANDMADKNVCVQPTDSLIAQAQQVTADVATALGGRRVDALLCVAGGFAMAKANSDGAYVLLNQRHTCRFYRQCRHAIETVRVDIGDCFATGSTPL
jgi:hypothetical protein